MVIAIIRAKDSNPWIWYGIGVTLQLISILGMQKRYAAFGMSSAMSGTWIAFIVIAVVSALIIVSRKK